VILLAVIAAALRLRTRFPVLSFGVLLFLLLLAPTSSVIPLADALVERRMYLPSIGLIVCLVSLVSLMPMRGAALIAAMCAVLVPASVLTWRRSQLWGEPVALWKDAVSKSPRKVRAYPHLIYSYVLAKRCHEAVTMLEQAGSAVPRDYAILISEAEAYACALKLDQALDKLVAASALDPSAEVHGLMSLVLARSGRREEALKYAELAISKEPPTSDMAYFYRGQWFAIAQQYEAAEAEYSSALKLNPQNAEARSAMSNLRRANPFTHYRAGPGRAP
jgi:tetratricopeptide (TPR) repeat protein